MNRIFIVIIVFFISNIIGAQVTDSLSLCTSLKFISTIPIAAEKDMLSHFYLTPNKIVWVSSDSLVTNAHVLLNKGISQVVPGIKLVCKIINKGYDQSGIILDFGQEIHGGVQITTMQGNNSYPRVRLRFGESVSEACGDLHNGKSGYGGGLATNHHSMRDFELSLPGFGTINVGNTGFRFLRIDLLGADAKLILKEIRAVMVIRDIPYLGSFKCNNERINKIWETGAYTVHLNMQEYLWDGIKRDRMVWAGDMHPSLQTISSVFGYHDIVPRTLDFLRDNTPLPSFMNGIPSYSMWWVIMQYDWYLYHGRLDYLQKQKDYLFDLLEIFSKYVDSEGNEQLFSVGMRFIDWPTYGDDTATHAGLQALLSMTFDRGAILCDYLDEPDRANHYRNLAQRMIANKPDPGFTKQAASLLALSGIMDAKQADEDIISVYGSKGFSTFYGYYMLEAQALAENFQGAINNISRFWGGMLDLGATTFWEEFDLDEAVNAARIDELVPDGQLDYHLQTGKECYVGLRRSLCHSWASGSTPWLSKHVLGIKILEPGCKTIQISPHLGDLEWVEGTFPTPMGLIKVSHKKKTDGSIKTTFDAPKGITVRLE
ncbi:MAG: hypothetical protein JW717_00610 [Marinilabiliaceae bacterium]|nr:hypothetical protein [Marinilabiliaceae bacterium]